MLFIERTRIRCFLLGGRVDLACKLADLDHSSTSPNLGQAETPDAPPSFRVLHEDSHVCAVVKPNRLLVHRTDIDFHEPHNLRDLLNKTRERDAWLQPVHRLDKPTSGIVLFAPPGDALNALKLEFVHRRTSKTYYAVVRGWTEDEGVVEKPLPTAHNPAPKEAQTHYRTLARVELPHPVGPYETARYSVVECRPRQGVFTRFGSISGTCGTPSWATRGTATRSTTGSWPAMPGSTRSCCTPADSPWGILKATGR